MRFWDSSAIVPLLVEQSASSWAGARVDDDASMAVWWATEVECVSALSRLEREGSLSPNDSQAALDALTALAATWLEIESASIIKSSAIRVLRTHQLRAGDALQLAAAIVAAAHEPASLPFVTLDDRLALAAEREGFPVVRPT